MTTPTPIIRALAHFIVSYGIRKRTNGAEALAITFASRGGTLAILDELVQARTRWTTRPNMVLVARDLLRDQVHWQGVLARHREMRMHELRGALRDLVCAIEESIPSTMGSIKRYHEALAVARRALESTT